MTDNISRRPNQAICLEGLIIKGIGGFYYVESGDRIYECRARGVLRGKGAHTERVTPVAGDRCVITVHEGGLASLDRVLERRNSLLRPPLANLDNLFIVVFWGKQTIMPVFRGGTKRTKGTETVKTPIPFS